MANIAESFTTPGAARLGPNSPCARIARRLACIAFLVNFILYIVAASAGVLNAIQAGANSQLRKSIDQPLLAGMTVYLTALIALSFALPFALAFTQLGSFQWSKMQTVPWWAWFGGLLSIGSTMAGVMLAQKTRINGIHRPDRHVLAALRGRSRQLRLGRLSTSSRELPATRRMRAVARRPRSGN